MEFQRRPPSDWSAYLAETARRGHVAVDRTAALLHGVDAYALAELDLPLVPETAVVPGRRATRLTGVDGCVRRLAPVDIAQVDGAVATTPLRTALDLGAVLTRWHAFAAMNALARAGAFTNRDLVAELPRFRRRRGVRQLRELASRLEPRVESAMESRTLLAIIDAGLPAPVAQHEVTVSSGTTYRLDFAYARRRLAVEYDGAEYHSTLDQQVHDWRRRDELRAAGWTFIIVRAEDFNGPTAGRWLTDLRAELSVDASNRRW